MTNTYGDILAEKLDRWEQAAKRKKHIEANQTKNGGFTREFLESIGVAWPPREGWKEWYIKTGKGE